MPTFRNAEVGVVMCWFNIKDKQAGAVVIEALLLL